MKTEKDRMVEMVGRSITGETHNYKFKKIAPIVGVKISHEYASIIIANLDEITKAFEWFVENADKLSEVFGQFSDEEGREELSTLERVKTFFDMIPPVSPVLKLIPSILTFSRLKELSKDLLAGGSVDAEDLGEDGMCDLFGENPTELYAAIFWALSVNFPKLFAPFLKEEGGDASTLDSNPKA